MDRNEELEKQVEELKVMIAELKTASEPAKSWLSSLWSVLANHKNLLVNLIEIAAIIAIVLSMNFASCGKPPVIPVNDTTPASVQQASSTAGHTINNNEAQQISNAISEAKEKPSTAQASFTATSVASGIQQANTFAQNAGKTDSANAVLSDKPTVTTKPDGSVDVDAVYYGIHYANTKALSGYLDPRGYGVGYRDNRWQVDVGKEFNGSPTARVHYDLIQWK